MPEITWLDFTDKVPFEDEDWATSDRGWARVVGEEHTCGTYTDHKDTRDGDSRNGVTILAVAFHTVVCPLTGMKPCTNLGSDWFATIPEAKAFVQEKVTAYLAKQ